MVGMTNERKVNVLENLLLERDRQIRELQDENKKLQAEIEGFSNDILELQEIVTKTRRLNKEFAGTNKEMKKLKKRYKRDMKKIM